MARLTGKAIADWIQAHYSRIPSVTLLCVPYPPVIPDSPDELVIVTVSPGMGMTNERAFERIRFQIRCRAKQNNEQVAEANSLGIDTMLNTLLLPTTISTTLVNDFGWVGGGPAPMTVPDDTANRYSWICNYWIQSATSF